MYETLSEFCARNGFDDLLSQWDAAANLPLTPETIRYGSKQRVWWKCERGHRWQATVYTRTGSHTGCPYCAGRLPIPGETDLATCLPAVAAEWHPTKNLPLTPGQVLPGSHKTVWWRCPNGHEWRAQIKSRAAGCGCPVCAGRRLKNGENDLASRYPALARQWHPTRNGALRPEQIAPGTRRKVWWLCEKGHAWQASVASRTGQQTGCPVCAGRMALPGENDLATLCPAIAAEWHPDRNGALTPQMVTDGSNRKVWWLCSRGHAYAAAVEARIKRGAGCPYCAGRRVLPGFNDLATVYPDIAAEWQSELNGALTPRMVTAGSKRKVWWQCKEGHVWQAAVFSRTGKQKCGCPACAGRVSPEKQARYRALLGQQKQRDMTSLSANVA